MSKVQELQDYLDEEECQLLGVTLGDDPGSIEDVAAVILAILKYKDFRNVDLSN